MKKENARTTVLALGVVLAAFALPMNALATDVSGEISQDTTWTFSGSPYIITGDVTVNGGYTLTIEPGVSAKFEAATRLIILGKLVAKGTDTDRILFTSNDPAPTKGSWGGIVAPGAASIRFATIEHADSGLSAAGGFFDGPFPHVTISDSLLRNNTRGFAYYAYVESTVDRCTFENNTYAVWGQLIAISNSIFTNNEYAFYGILRRSAVYSSTFTGNQVALFSRDTRGEVKYSTISGNGTGVQGSYVSLSYNTIAANTIGIMQEFALPLGPLHHNNIYLNRTYNVQTGLFGVDATNDWWGTTDTPAIDAGI